MTLQLNDPGGVDPAIRGGRAAVSFTNSGPVNRGTSD